MEKPALTLKPHIIGAVVPMVLRNGVYSAIAAFVLYAVLTVFRRTQVVSLSTNGIVFLVVVVGVFLAIIPLLFKVILLYNTNYYFFRTHVVKEFELVKVSRQSVPYRQIANITINMTLWDRVIGSGDMILHTADDNAPNLMLDYIEEPHKIEAALYKVMKKSQ
jgi:hypothetical protein